MYYANYNINGEYIGFYTQEFHGLDIPSPNIILDEKQWQEALSGNYRVIKGKHTVYEKPEEEILSEVLEGIRHQRNLLLKESDVTQVLDFPITDEKREEWRVYRQQLRDMPNAVDVFNVVFPVAPE